MAEGVFVWAGFAGGSTSSHARDQKNSQAILRPGVQLKTSSELSKKAKESPSREALSKSEPKPAAKAPKDAPAPEPPAEQSSQRPPGDPKEKSESLPAEPSSAEPSSKDEPVKDEPVLSPGDPEENNHEKKEGASAKIFEAQELIRTVNPDNLSKQQHETLATIESFLTKSREALSMKDYPRALNLAKKAHTLANELVNSVQDRRNEASE